MSPRPRPAGAFIPPVSGHEPASKGGRKKLSLIPYLAVLGSPAVFGAGGCQALGLMDPSSDAASVAGRAAVMLGWELGCPHLSTELVLILCSVAGMRANGCPLPLVARYGCWVSYVCG